MVVEGEIIHALFAYMNMQKLIIPSEEDKNGTMSLSELTLQRSHRCTQTLTSCLYSLSISVCHSLSLPIQHYVV